MGNADIQTVGARLALASARHSDRIALTEGAASIAYGNLDAAATSLARGLRIALGRTPGRVALFFERKLPAIQAIFGAARCGHAYVMLDASDPEERLRNIVADCEPLAILTETPMLERAREIAPAGCATLALESADCAGLTEPLPDVAPDAPLYICYTSGSTGRPKGVIQTHRNVLFFFDAYARSIALREGDRHTLLYTLSFNAANTDIYGALMHGATLCAGDVRREGFAALADWLDRERITVYHSVPTVFREMCQRLPADRTLPHLRIVDLGGEAVFGSDVDHFRRHTRQGALFVNQLACTEAGLIAQHVIGHDAPHEAAPIVPVGRCPDGVRVEIRREDGSRAAAGESGEIVVCSVHVSPGYWRRPELDAIAFSADPDIPKVRRYVSGDVGFVDTSGRLTFQGRKGSRVKVHGYSVDLMEIEAALSACPGVAKSAVLALPADPPADSARLCAYVAPTSGDERDSQILRARLAARVPAYMLPAAIVFVDALPLTPSGKIDRLALARLPTAQLVTIRAVDAPRDAVECDIAAIFAELLAITPVGRDDDFFLLGGDSLLGVELQSRLRGRFGVHVGNLHEYSTVAGIAAGVRDMGAGSIGASRKLPVLFPLWRQGRHPPLFLVHGRHGQAFVSPHFMRLLGDDQPVWAFQARGLDGVAMPHPTVEAMATDYLHELRSVRPEGPYFIGALCAGAYVAAAMARALRDAGEVVLPLLLLDPPERLIHGGYAQMSEATFIAKMAARRAQGRTVGPAADPAYFKIVHRVAMAFEQAIVRYRPQAYDGAAYMLSSRQRVQSGRDAGLRAIFSGRIARYEVGATHAEALDPRNEVFARHLAECLAGIRDAAARLSASAEAQR